VTDAGSVKSAVVSQVEVEVSPVDLERFIGGHPMGGSERSGPEGASASLLDGIVWAFTPTAGTDPERLTHLENWTRSVGARPMRMEPAQHDRAVAIVSHLPQVASSTLMSLAAREEAGEEEILLLAAGGFRDLTRLAASNPSLWVEIMESNRGEVARAIDLYVDDLVRLRNLIASGASGREAIEESLAEAKRARLAMATKPQVKSGVGVLQIPVPDRPGVLADLTAAMGEKGVNIEDLQIVHSLEGAKGTVHLTVAASDAEAAESALAEHGFESVRLA
jgi:prephenate dehydrogenase